MALLHWGDLIEDFLDTIGVSFAAFRDEMTGGWLFGFVGALATARVDVVVVCVSNRVAHVEHHRHRATGVLLCVLPASRPYRALRRTMADRYAWSAGEVVRSHSGGARLAALAAWEVAPHLATPLRGLGRELRRHGCTAVLCQEYEYARLDSCLVLGRLLRLPVFATYQGGDRSQTPLERLVRPSAVRAAAGLVIASEGEARRVQERYGVPRTRVAQVFNPLDVEAWAPADRAEARAELGLPADALVVAWHGRVDLSRKGLDVLVEAWRLLTAQDGADLRLLLLGTGQDAGELRERIALARLQGVHWVDAYVTDRDRVRRHLSAADVYAFPSRHEGFPVAPVEALAVGLPVVAAAAPGVAEILAGGEGAGGIVVPVGDAPALAAGLSRPAGSGLVRATLRGSPQACRDRVHARRGWRAAATGTSPQPEPASARSTGAAVPEGGAVDLLQLAEVLAAAVGGLEAVAGGGAAVGEGGGVGEEGAHGCGEGGGVAGGVSPCGCQAAAGRSPGAFSVRGW